MIVSSRAEVYKLSNSKFNLPVNKKWLTKKSKSVDAKTLVFFSPVKKGRRIVITLYRSGFRFPLENIDDFAKLMKEKKTRSLKKMNHQLIMPIKIDINKKSKKVTYRIHFDTTNSSFIEYGIYQQCKKEGFNLKVIVPSSSRLPSTLKGFMGTGQICPLS